MEKTDNMEKIVDLRSKLDKKREELEKELEEINTIIKLLDNIIEKQSFQPATELIEEKEEKPIRQEVFFIWEGKEYAWLVIYQDKVIVNISPDLNLSIESKLVNYIKREMDKYFNEDLKLEVEGKIDPNKRFTYTIDEEDGKLTQVEFYDYGKENRRRDLLGKIKWVLKTHSKENL